MISQPLLVNCDDVLEGWDLGTSMEFNQEERLEDLLFCVTY